jgi:hypothetical protein
MESSLEIDTLEFNCSANSHRCSVRHGSIRFQQHIIEFGRGIEIVEVPGVQKPEM